MWLTVSENSVHGRLTPRREHHGGRAWWSKAALFMADRKQSKRIVPERN